MQSPIINNSYPIVLQSSPKKLLYDLLYSVEYIQYCFSFREFDRLLFFYSNPCRGVVNILIRCINIHLFAY